MYFRNGPSAVLGKVSREGLSSCHTGKRYKVEWSDVDSDRRPQLTLFEFETESQTWAGIVAARFDREIPLSGLVFCEMTELKFPLPTCKLHPE